MPTCYNCVWTEEFVYVCNCVSVSTQDLSHTHTHTHSIFIPHRNSTTNFLFQTHMTLFLQWNNKREILKNLYASVSFQQFVFLIMRSWGLSTRFYDTFLLFSKAQESGSAVCENSLLDNKHTQVWNEWVNHFNIFLGSCFKIQDENTAGHINRKMFCYLILNVNVYFKTWITLFTTRGLSLSPLLCSCVLITKKWAKSENPLIIYSSSWYTRWMKLHSV